MSVNIFFLIQIMCIVIPAAGLAALMLNREQDAPSVRLAVADTGCLIMNGASLLLASSKNISQANTAVKMQASGNTLFFLFFFLFMLSYLRVNHKKMISVIWAVFECVYIASFWSDILRQKIIGHYSYSYSRGGEICLAYISPLWLYRIRNILILVFLFAGLGYTAISAFGARSARERFSLTMLAGASLLMSGSFVFDIIASPGYEAVPMFSSVAMLAIILGLMKGEFSGVIEMGRVWAADRMKNAYVITNSDYGYLDSNDAAEVLFPELKEQLLRKQIPVEVYELMISKDTYLCISERYFNKEVKEIVTKNEVSGYVLFLEDVTEQRERTNYLRDYNTRLMDDINKHTKHLRAMQDSIITGIASVVESRDNSTGGHINRTSAVVKIFSEKLLEKPEIMYELGIDHRFLENVEKAAPLHDLGKIAVDDVILRKPGRFTDEEYEKMKKHPEEGAKVLKRVLVEADDLDFVNIAINVAHYHHERWDGKGYPNGLESEEIPVEARIMALADVFDALVSKRCYKEAYSYDKAFSIIEEGLGTQFDPVLGKVFEECRPQLEDYYDIA